MENTLALLGVVVEIPILSLGFNNYRGARNWHHVMIDRAFVDRTRWRPFVRVEISVHSEEEDQPKTLSSRAVLDRVG